jgi:hypothetical protein
MTDRHAGFAASIIEGAGYGITARHSQKSYAVASSRDGILYSTDATDV